MSCGDERGDRGAALIEAALVLPVLLFLLLGFFDFTYANLKESDATNAARDGARVGMLNRTAFTTSPQTTCSVPGDAGFNTICNQVRSNLTAAPVNTVQVQCFEGVGPAVNPANPLPCNSTLLRADRSTIEVTVVWQLVPMTAVGDTFIGTQTKTTKSRMVIIN